MGKKHRVCSFEGMDLLERVAKIKTRFGDDSPNMFLDLSSSKVVLDTSFCESPDGTYLRTTVKGPEDALLSMFIPIVDWAAFKAKGDAAVQKHKDFHSEFPEVATE